MRKSRVPVLEYTPNGLTKTLCAIWFLQNRRTLLDEGSQRRCFGRVSGGKDNSKPRSNGRHFQVGVRAAHSRHDHIHDNHIDSSRIALEKSDRLGSIFREDYLISQRLQGLFAQLAKSFVILG